MFIGLLVQVIYETQRDFVSFRERLTFIQRIIITIQGVVVPHHMVDSNVLPLL